MSGGRIFSKLIPEAAKLGTQQIQRGISTSTVSSNMVDPITKWLQYEKAADRALQEKAQEEAEITKRIEATKQSAALAKKKDALTIKGHELFSVPRSNFSTNAAPLNNAKPATTQTYATMLEEARQKGLKLQAEKTKPTSGIALPDITEGFDISKITKAQYLKVDSYADLLAAQKANEQAEKTQKK